MIILRSKLFSLNQNGEDTITINCSNGPLTLKKYYPSKPIKWLGKVIKPLGRAQEKALYYDVYLGDKKIGEINLGEETPIELIISWIGINKEYRGNHYATEILKHFINFARSKKYRVVTIEWDKGDPVAIDIYKKLGFVIDKDRSGETLTIMHKSL